MQLQLTVNQLLERVQVLEAMVTAMGTIVNATSDSLQGEMLSQATSNMTFYSLDRKYRSCK